MVEGVRETSARTYEHVAAELEVAARHCRTTAQHVRDGEIPRAAAHAWAAFGHIQNATEQLVDQARLHARKSTT
jgi:hypothetical protein